MPTYRHHLLPFLTRLTAIARKRISLFCVAVEMSSGSGNAMLTVITLAIMRHVSSDVLLL